MMIGHRDNQRRVSGGQVAMISHRDNQRRVSGGQGVRGPRRGFATAGSGTGY